MADPEHLSILDVARQLGWSKRDAREKLQRLHDRHGGLLYRESDAPNAKVWVDPVVLGRVWSTRFDEAGRIKGVDERIRLAEEAVDRIIQDLLEAKDALLDAPAKSRPRNPVRTK